MVESVTGGRHIDTRKESHQREGYFPPSLFWRGGLRYSSGGSWLGSIKGRYLRPARRSRCSAFAAASNCGSSNRSQAVAASVRAASTIPLRPIVVPPAATACQEWAGVPG